MWVSRSSKDHQCLYCLSCAAKVLIKNAKVIIYFTTVKGYRVIANVSFVYPAWPTPSPGLLCYLSNSEEDLGTRLLVYLVFPDLSCLGGCVCVGVLNLPWIWGSTEALTRKRSTIVNLHAKSSWVLLVLLRCRQMTHDFIKFFFQPFIQGNFLFFKIARRHDKIFFTPSCTIRAEMVMATRLLLFRT